jgi:lysophospholipase L1-like esterase
VIGASQSRDGRSGFRRLAFGSVLGLCLVMAFAAPSSGAVAKDKPVYYVALGDSLAIGVQPTGTSADGATEDGYADQLADMLRAEIPDLRLVKLGCGGESTGTMLGVVQPTRTAEGCGPGLYPHGTQLADAVSFLHAHRNHLALVTIDIGANDTFRLLDLDRACFDVGTQHIRTNLAKILAELQAAAGPDTVIVGMTRIIFQKVMPEPGTLLNRNQLWYITFAPDGIKEHSLVPSTTPTGSTFVSDIGVLRVNTNP